MLLPQQPTLIQTRAFAERLRCQIAATAIDIDHGQQSLTIAISLGVTACMRGEPFNVAYARADQALYAAKAGGRNRVEARE